MQDGKQLTVQGGRMPGVALQYLNFLSTEESAWPVKRFFDGSSLMSLFVPGIVKSGYSNVPFHYQFKMSGALLTSHYFYNTFVDYLRYIPIVFSI